jgi:hypothetical protein
MWVIFIGSSVIIFIVALLTLGKAVIMFNKMMIETELDNMELEEIKRNVEKENN